MSQIYQVENENSPNAGLNDMADPKFLQYSDDEEEKANSSPDLSRPNHSMND